MKKIKTVQELIDELLKIEDKGKNIYVYQEDCWINDIQMVDELSDRVDLNI